MTLIQRRQARQLVAICSLAYFCSYLTRINYAAVMVEVIANEGVSRVEASAALTGLFIFYGAGQLVSGYLGDRLAPQKLVFTGLLICSVMNLLLPLCSAAWERTAVWSVNGFAQAMLWPPLVKIISGRFSDNAYKKAVVWVSSGGLLATVFVYLCTPLIINVSGWRPVFYMSASAAFGMAFLWRKKYEEILPKTQPADTVSPRLEATRPVPMPKGILGMIALILGAVMLQGMLRDGISSWMPTYLNESFFTGSAAAIMSSVAIPALAIITNYIVLYINRRLIRNEILCAAAVFSAGFVALIVLRLAGQGSFAVSAAALTVAAASMNGVNMVLITLLPKYFERFGNISFMSGLLNFFVYVGSALSSFGIAALAEGYGWPMTVLAWCVIALLGTALCLACVRGWGRSKLN